MLYYYYHANSFCVDDQHEMTTNQNKKEAKKYTRQACYDMVQRKYMEKSTSHTQTHIAESFEIAIGKHAHTSIAYTLCVHRHSGHCAILFTCIERDTCI